MERKNTMARVFFILFILGYLLVAAAEYAFDKETKVELMKEQRKEMATSRHN